VGRCGARRSRQAKRPLGRPAGGPGVAAEHHRPRCGSGGRDVDGATWSTNLAGTMLVRVFPTGNTTDARSKERSAASGMAAGPDPAQRPVVPIAAPPGVLGVTGISRLNGMARISRPTQHLPSATKAGEASKAESATRAGGFQGGHPPAWPRFKGRATPHSALLPARGPCQHGGSGTPPPHSAAGGDVWMHRSHLDGHSPTR